VLIYSLFLMIITLAMVSLAVDYAHVQLVKTQLQRGADASARGALEIYEFGGPTNAATWGPLMAGNTYNPVDANSGISDTYSLTWGYWTAATKTFTTTSGPQMAVKVIASRTAANKNAVPLIFPLMAGLGLVPTTCDVSAQAIAVLQPKVSSTSTVLATADLWLSGMPAGSTASYCDTTSNAPPVLAMNVTAGTTLTFSATGTTFYNTSSSPNISADGDSIITSHMQYSPDGNHVGLQNGIQTITSPTCALLGVFLNAYAPNTQTAPTSGLDYTSSTSQNQASYSSLQLQQPFFIGDGTNSGSTVQSFIVPTGATRLYLGVYDQCENSDNPGSLTVTTTQMPVIFLVQ
jgi:hypothetical protein